MTGFAGDRFQQLRLVEALLFASAEPVSEAALAQRLPEGTDLAALLDELRGLYANRGVRLVQVGGKWAFRTASDLAPLLRVQTTTRRRLSRAAIETLAVIAYHQPVTRAEIEEIRGVSLSRGLLEILLEAGWIRVGRRRQTPGRPVTWLTTEKFLDHFGLASREDLPGIEELKAAGLLDKRPALEAFGSLGDRANVLRDADETGDSGDSVSEDEPRLPLAAGAGSGRPPTATKEGDDARESAAGDPAGERESEARESEDGGSGEDPVAALERGPADAAASPASLSAGEGAGAVPATGRLRPAEPSEG